MAVVYAYNLYMEKTPITLRELGRGLFCYGKLRKTRGVPMRRKVAYSSPSSVRLTNIGVHWPKFVDEKCRCEVCSNEGIESRPSSICSHCGVYLFCNKSKNCFVKYHT